jgi:fermentation-respiration switch protein FrsA (DUF1100 family)
MYVPDTAPVSAAAVPGAEDVVIVTPDGTKLRAWHAPARDGRPTIILFHGNAGSLAGRTDRFEFLRSRGFGLLFVSYRGYGGSGGSPTEAGLVEDGLAAYDWLAARGLKGGDIAIIGESLGSGVAVRVAAKRKVAALVLEAPFSSAVDVAKDQYWWLPVDLLMKDRFDSASVIGQVHVPLLIVHGDADEVTPYALGKRMLQAANEPKRMITIPGGTHASIFEEPVWEHEARFLDQVMRSPAS